MKKKTKKRIRKIRDFVVKWLPVFVLFAIMVSAIAFAAEPKFHMGDKVRVTEGFYRGCVNGTVVDYMPGFDGTDPDEYFVEDLVCNGKTMRQLVALPEKVLSIELTTK